MLSTSIKHILMAIAFSLLAQSATANLLINPTRVDFNNDTRTADVTLINTSQTTNTYRVQWDEKKATETGYDELNEVTAAAFPVASRMIRYSPRQVTLKPGERQTVKLALRRPQGLANGEYRSHLLFKALAPAPKTKTAGDAPNLQFNIILSFAIPVVVVQGALQYEVAIENASINYNPNKKEGSVEVSLSRSGSNSVIGNISAYWTPNGGKESLIAKAGDFNFWPEINRAKATLGWAGTDFAKSDGKLRIVYEGTKGFRGKTFSEKTISISGGMIKTVN